MSLHSCEMQFIMSCLATWRITHLLTSEDGPGDLVFKLRKKLGNSLPGKAMDCFYCSSLWVAVPFTAFLSREVIEAVITWLALSGAACLLEKAFSSAQLNHK